MASLRRGTILENASALTAARRTWRSGSLIDTVNAAMDSLKLEKSDHADGLHANRGVAIRDSLAFGHY